MPENVEIKKLKKELEELKKIVREKERTIKENNDKVSVYIPNKRYRLKFKELQKEVENNG